MSRVFSSIAEIKAAIGEELGPSEPLVIDQDRITAFADATEDHQWIHVDPDRAASGPYGGTIAHGYLTLSLIPYFAQRLFTVDFGTARLNYGLNKVRFPAPVPVGSTLRATSTFLDIVEGPNGATLTTRYVLTADGAPKPSCIAEMLIVIRS